MGELERIALLANSTTCADQKVNGNAGKSD